jgi:hypothetical protein
MRARKVDANQCEIVQALGQAGYHVTDLSAVGKGCPDLLVTRFGQCGLVEVKNKEGRNRFTPAQVEYYAAAKCPIYIIRSVNDVISLIKGQLQPINSEKQGINDGSQTQKGQTERINCD